MAKKRVTFEQVKAVLEASRDSGREEKARLRAINEKIMTLPEAVRPMAQSLMFSTKMSAEEIIEAARHAHGGEEIPEVTDNRRLGSLGRATASVLLGKEDPGVINFDPAEPNILTVDPDDPLAKAGAALAKKFKAEGYLGPVNSRSMA